MSATAGESAAASPAVAPPSPPLFRQLWDHEGTGTYTYILGDPATREAVMIDPVLEHVERDLQVLDEMGLTLKYAINTHCHADHVTGTGKIKALRPGVRSMIAAASGAAADVLLHPGDSVAFGGLALRVLPTPGHTDGCVTYYLPPPPGSSAWPGMAFTGDALLIRGCGRCDFQQGDPRRMYDSVHSQLFTLPGDTLVYPAHEYKGRSHSTIDEERRHNPRLTRPLEEFVAIMEGLGLPRPKRMDVAVPANLCCGAWEVPEADPPRA